MSLFPTRATANRRRQSGSSRLFLAALCALAPILAAAEQSHPGRVADALRDGTAIWPPYVQGNLSLDVYNDYTVAADGPDDEINDLTLDAALGTFVYFTPRVYLESAWRVDPARDPEPGEHRWLDHHALKWGVLAFTYERERFWVSIGKGSVPFGIAKDLGAGVYGADIADDYYSLKGRIGASFSVSLDAGRWGNHALRGGAFTLDTSWFATPFFSGQDGPKRSNGGAGNTNGLNSFVLVLDGAGIPSLPGFRYHLGVVRQATDFLLGADGERLPASAVDDEERYVAAVEWNNLALGGGYSVSPLLEYAHLADARGIDGRNESYLTGSLAFFKGQWNLALAATGWRVNAPGSAADDNLSAQISGGFLFENGVALDLGYQYLDEDGERSHIVGLALNYELPFAF